MEAPGQEVQKVASEHLARLGYQDSQASEIAALLGDVARLASQESPPDGPPFGSLLVTLVAALPEGLLMRAEDLPVRSRLSFEVRESGTEEALDFASSSDGPMRLSAPRLHSVVQAANSALLALERFTSVLRVPISDLLGLRNLSSLVSAVVVAETASEFSELLFPNPHQDGYPDLLPRSEACLDYLDQAEASGRMSDKALWTDPGFGGVEVKATCGNTPPAKKIPKPGLGETRSAIVVGYDWKAHHRETERLLATVWDFVDGIPTVTAAFFRNDLSEDDWGKVVSPKAGGGRTTSVSIMSRSGIDRMAAGWIVRCTSDPFYSALAQGRLRVG